MNKIVKAGAAALALLSAAGCAQTKDNTGSVQAECVEATLKASGISAIDRVVSMPAYDDKGKIDNTQTGFIGYQKGQARRSLTDAQGAILIEDGMPDLSNDVTDAFSQAGNFCRKKTSAELLNPKGVDVPDVSPGQDLNLPGKRIVLARVPLLRKR